MWLTPVGSSGPLQTRQESTFVPALPLHHAAVRDWEELQEQLPLVPRKDHKLGKWCLQQINIIQIMCNFTKAKFHVIAEVIVDLAKYLRGWW